MHEKLLVVLQESQEDNQELLKLLFALKDDLPLKNCITQAKVDIPFSFFRPSARIFQQKVSVDSVFTCLTKSFEFIGS